MGPLLHLSTVFHGASKPAIPDAEPSLLLAMPSQVLADAYEALLNRAPAPLFTRARKLYLDKYCLEGRDTESPLRLFVARENLREQIDTDLEAGPNGRIATLTSETKELALVHWQQDSPPDHDLIETYLSNRWQCQPTLMTPSEQRWFRNSGYQVRITLSTPLIWVRSTRYQETDNQSIKEKPTKS